MINGADSIPVVSVCCTTYNHQEFIGQAIEGFLMQKTNFKIEVIIGNDCSADGTLEEIKPYALKYPNIIRVINNPKNLGAHLNTVNVLEHCTGKYIALCEGDDFWIDENKLQKQVDFLESNPDYIICCHYIREVAANNELLYVHPKPRPLEYTYFDLLAGKQEETKTSTVVYRNNSDVHEIFAKKWFFDCHAGDKMFKLFATGQTQKKIYVMPEVMSCYRNHVGGIWSMINKKVRTRKMISDFNLIITNFRYPEFLKKKLLLLYVKRYLLFELQHLNIRNAYNTVKYLL
jgi:glycosyltransferase involved in cell wall biosynthesis